MPNSNEYTVRVSSDFDNAVTIRYREGQVTIPYEHLYFVKKDIEQFIAHVEMTRTLNYAGKP
jgi:hypothetical protein